ncbi:hypothetical protein GCM10010103_33200 [Streptomyces paradoxus]|uniref:Uncharacterized protein n=1 Tax=Streptomyces paradoxus TaxID=66375 RepID=A0A7W9WIA3_9ACTN|nr:hypothetical protein [Streptomyces paradoxus]MBB6077225.1 hypothetical protein [Streptomyces paradoxus]
MEEIGGLSPFQIGLLSAIPWICAVVAMYTMSHFTDRAADRRPYLAIALVLSATGTFLATLGSPWFGLAALTLAAVGGKCAATLFWPMAQSGLDLKIAAPGPGQLPGKPGRVRLPHAVRLPEGHDGQHERGPVHAVGGVGPGGGGGGVRAAHQEG